MKYKVGDKVRISENLYFQPMVKAGEVVEIIEVKNDDEGLEYYYMHKLPDVGISEEFISHRAISQITDDDISEFKREKIAWYFDDKYSYHKALQILEKEGITFNEKNECKEYFDIYEKFGIAYHGGFGFGDVEYFKSKGYQIIEIMNPVYVPKFDLPCEHFETTHVWVETSDGKRLTKPMYKGRDCETMFQFCEKYKGLIEELKKL